MTLQIVGEAARYEEVFYPQWFLAPMGMELAQDSLRASVDAEPRVSLLVEHEGWPLAATGVTGVLSRLTIANEDWGISYESELDPDQADALLAWQKVDAGLFAEASIGFKITDADIALRGDEEVLVVRVADLDRGDISIVRYGGNPNTNSRTKSSALAGRMTHVRRRYRLL